MFTYDMYVGTQRPGKFLDLLNTREYAQLTWESRRNAGALGANGNPTHAQFGNGPEPVIPDYIFPAGAMEGDPRVARDANGNYIKGWGGPGEGYDWPAQIHGLFIDYKGNLWTASERAGLPESRSAFV